MIICKFTVCFVKTDKKNKILICQIFYYIARGIPFLEAFFKNANT